MEVQDSVALSHRHDRMKGRLCVLGAVLMWSSCGLFARAPIFDDWPAMQRGVLLAFWRAAFAALVLLPTVRRPRFRPMLVPLGLCFALMNVTYLSAIIFSYEGIVLFVFS